MARAVIASSSRGCIRDRDARLRRSRRRHRRKNDHILRSGSRPRGHAARCTPSNADRGSEASKAKTTVCVARNGKEQFVIPAPAHPALGCRLSALGSHKGRAAREPRAESRQPGGWAVAIGNLLAQPGCMRRTAFILPLVLVLGIACSTNPVTGNREFNIVSEAQE